MKHLLKKLMVEVRCFLHREAIKITEWTEIGCGLAFDY